MKIRLNKFLADNGICSRREADEHILDGEVVVNGTRAKVGQKIDPDKDIVEYQGHKIEISAKEFKYYALNKPRGVISTSNDEKGRKTVLDLVPKEPRIYPVGRLDKNSEGLIILTNDGDLTLELSHPSKGHEKEYLVESRIKNKELSKEQVARLIEKRFTSGLMIDGKIMKADRAKVTIIHDSRFLIQVTIHTGYNRQIRKMCDKIGLEVLRLKRVRISSLKLNQLDLKPGEYKEISKTQIYDN